MNKIFFLLQIMTLKYSLMWLVIFLVSLRQASAVDNSLCAAYPTEGDSPTMKHPFPESFMADILMTDHVSITD